MGSLRPVYPDDERFRLSFREKSIGVAQTRNKRIVRYILFELERQASGNSHDFEDSRITLEHVLPLNPEDAWDEFGEGELDAQTARLGNMALLEAGPNRDAGNAGYEADGIREEPFPDDPGHRAQVRRVDAGDDRGAPGGHGKKRRRRMAYRLSRLKPRPL